MAASLSKDSALLRARNQVWNAAGDYTIEPWRLFTESDNDKRVVEQSKSADRVLYMNTATGLMVKWFGDKNIKTLVDGWKEDFRASQLDDLAWLAFESASYARESSERPALVDLRQAFLEAIPDDKRTVFDQLQCAGMSYDDICQRVREVAHEQYHFDGHVITAPDTKLHLGVSILSLVSHPKIKKHGAKGHLSIVGEGETANTTDADASTGDAYKKEGVIKGLIDRYLSGRRENDLRYIQGCFGPLEISPSKLADLERLTCTGIHEGCRLWVADGTREPPTVSGAEFERLKVQAQRQYERNLERYESNRRRYEAAAQSLAHTLSEHLRADCKITQHRCRAGALDARLAWRIDALNDQRVFSRKVRIEHPDVCVDLLLDASGSRADQQGEIAAQAYVFNKGLALCGIPVRMSAFCSVRDYTVLRMFGTFSTEVKAGALGADNSVNTSARDVFRYYAAGMNRDGLALRMVGALPANQQNERRLIVILTDAAPMDDRGIAKGDHFAARADYVGRPAIEDTADEVRKLRKDGIAVAAIFSGEDENLQDCRDIYDKDFVRIYAIERMADAAAMLVANALERTY